MPEISVKFRHSDCDADHCTPEERAVIEWAVKRRRMEKILFPFGAPGSGHSLLNELFVAEQEWADKVLAARAGKETG